MFFTALKDGKDWGAGASGSQFLLAPRRIHLERMHELIGGERQRGDGTEPRGYSAC